MTDVANDAQQKPLPPYAGFAPISHQEFVEGLSDLAFQQAKWLYTNDTVIADDVSPWQGDLVLRADMIVYNRTGQPTLRQQRPAMFVSPGCDLEPDRRKRFSLLVPVSPLAQLLNEYSTDPMKQDELRAAITSNGPAELMYLPASEQFPESVADFSRACSVPINLIRQQYERSDATRERLRLTKQGWWLLIAKITYYVGRDEGAADYPRPFVTVVQ